MMKNNQHHKGTSILPRQNKSQGGFLELIVIVLVALILLRFLNIDINGILAKGWVKEFLGYTKEMLVLVWQDIVAIYRSIRGA
ncbi:hypothetical protein H7X65_00595 [Candidatus Parcubacteria bacterium]|nr:hypothetical protein [Candidatus Parcubacteria bacterium]